MERKSDHGFRRPADEVRSRPLTEVAPLLGYEQDRNDRCRWRRDGSVIRTNEPKYYDHIAGCGGGGAVDLVIHALGCNPMQAINWLAGRQSPPGTAKPAGAGSARLDDLKSAGHLWAEARRPLPQARPCSR